MTKEEILEKVDHTLLKQQATEKDIKELCDEAIEFNTASICIPPSYVSFTKDYVKDRIKICTVIGFPNGYNTTKIKVEETKEALDNGADEIDMVINIGFLKDKKYNEILNEINSIKEVCGNKILKVIIETCLLTEEEKIKMCEIVSSSNADFIKTSTGFSEGGATLEDIKLMNKYMTNNKKIKAAGGISSFEDAEAFVNNGASRLGTSRLIKLLNNKYKEVEL